MAANSSSQRRLLRVSVIITAAAIVYQSWRAVTVTVTATALAAAAVVEESWQAVTVTVTATALTAAAVVEESWRAVTVTAVLDKRGVSSP